MLFRSMNMPKPFTGKRDELKRFMQNCKIYLQINKKKYDTNLAKIGFVLALMNEGDAATWKEQVLDQAADEATALGATDLNLGTYYKNHSNHTTLKEMP